jgi:hypothetical protein
MPRKVKWTRKDVEEYADLAERVSDAILRGTRPLTAEEISKYDKLLPMFLEAKNHVEKFQGGGTGDTMSYIRNRIRMASAYHYKAVYRRL